MIFVNFLLDLWIYITIFIVFTRIYIYTNFHRVDKYLHTETFIFCSCHLTLYILIHL